MNSRKYLAGAVVTAAIASLAIAIPAFAATNGPGMPPGGPGWGQGSNGQGHPTMSGSMTPGVAGSVTAISGTSITVQSQRNNTTYTVDASNATVTKNNAASNVSSIAVGDTIFAQGTVSGTSVTATKIMDGKFGMGMRGGAGMQRPAVVGQVASISGTTLTVTSRGFGQNTATTTYTVDASNATVMKNNATSSVSSISVGDNVAIQGTVSGTNVTATMIRDGVGRMGMGSGSTTPAIQGNGEPVIAGTVASISGSSFTLTNNGSATYTIDASSAIVTKGNTASSVSNIAVGDHVLVQGSVSGTSISATSVIDQSSSANSNHPGFFGRIGQFFQHLFGL